MAESMTRVGAASAPGPTEDRIAALQAALKRRGPYEAFALLGDESDDVIVQVLLHSNPATAVQILWGLPEGRREAVLRAAPDEWREQWTRNRTYPEGTIGRLMDHPLAVFAPNTSVRDAIARLGELVRHAFITYGYITEPDGRLVGVLVFRELLFASPDQPLADIMVREPFSLRPDARVIDALRQVLVRHYPVYPVCDDHGRLVGVVRGPTLFEQQAVEISAQAGTMVGVEKEERLSTPWWRSLRWRHPWLQLNLLTAFVAAAVVGFFQETIDQVVVLAVFLPVLAGQSGNTGCQALAVTLRGMTLGELEPGKARTLVVKEAWLGLLNGALVGVSAGIGMFVVARSQGHPAAWLLALVTFLAMTGSCIASGISGAVVPMTLQRLGADPATASSIFLTTATDVASMGLFLGLATWLIL
jgi:magnesium transporter